MYEADGRPATTCRANRCARTLPGGRYVVEAESMGGPADVRPVLDGLEVADGDAWFDLADAMP